MTRQDAPGAPAALDAPDCTRDDLEATLRALLTHLIRSVSDAVNEVTREEPRPRITTNLPQHHRRYRQRP